MEQDQASPIATMAGLRSSCFSDSLKAVWYFSAWSWAHTWPIQISGRVNAKKHDIQTFSDNSSLDWEADPYQYLLATSDYQWVDMQVDGQCLFWWNIRINFSLIDEIISLLWHYVPRKCYLFKISHSFDFYDKGVKLTRLTANALLSFNLYSRPGLTLQEQKIKLSEKTWTGSISPERDCRVQRSLDTGTRVRGKLYPPLLAVTDADI